MAVTMKGPEISERFDLDDIRKIRAYHSGLSLQKWTEMWQGISVRYPYMQAILKLLRYFIGIVNVNS